VKKDPEVTNPLDIVFERALVSKNTEEGAKECISPWFRSMATWKVV
jgi:hypothetical protein